MILLFSGGLDSYIAYHFLGKPVTLYCDLGHRYAALETAAVRDLLPKTIIDTRLRLSDWEASSAHIPLRNAFLVMIASAYDKNVGLIVQKGEMDLPDRSTYFFNEFGNILSFLWEDQVIITSPFFKMTKTDIVKWYMDHEFSFKEKRLAKSKLLRTRSCFSVLDMACGQCAACFRRWVAFTNNDISEFYYHDITKWDGIQEYVTKMENGMYDPKRTDETFSALKKAKVL